MNWSFTLDHPGEWAKLFSAVEDRGLTQDSRNGPVTEILCASIKLRTPGLVTPRGVRKGINHGIAAVEAAQLVAGEAFPELQVAVAGKMADFQDGEVFHGAYGPRLRNQMEGLIEELHAHPESRRAFVTIWDPAYDQQDRRDLPCTTSFQFLRRDGYMYCIVNMRSNDVVWGTTYDLFQFGILHRAVAKCFGDRCAPLTVNVGSLHIYHDTAPEIVHVLTKEEAVQQSPQWSEEPYAPPFGDNPIECWRMMRRHARLALEAAEDISFNPSQPTSWAWFTQQIRKARFG